MGGDLSATSVGKVSSTNSFYRGTSWFILMTGRHLTGRLHGTSWKICPAKLT